VWEGACPDEAHAGSENYRPSNSAIKSLNRSTFSALIAVAASPSMYSANCATVLHSNIARNGTSRCNVFCTREAIYVASNECPPSSKKLSCTPTLSTLSTSAQIAAKVVSSSLRGAR